MKQSKIKDSYNAVMESRKLVMTYASIIAATIVSFLYVRIIPGVEEFLSYFPHGTPIEPSVVVSVYNKNVDAIDSVMVNLFLLAGGIIAAYMSVNVWQKFSPGYSPRPNHPYKGAPSSDDSDPEEIPDEV